MRTLLTSRRGFLIGAATVAGGLAIGVAQPLSAASVASRPWPGDSKGAEFSPWLLIMPSGEIVVRVAPPDIGNGVMTQMAMTLNEELQGDWADIRTEYADTLRDLQNDRAYSKVLGSLSYFSGRSTSDERMQNALLVGATARECLKRAAAQRWGVPVEEVSAGNSLLSHAASGRQLRYGEVAEAASQVELMEEPALKPRSEWQTLGKVSRSKLQDPRLVNGSAVFGIDVQVPDKVYAALRQCPVHGGRLVRVDREAVLGMPGVLEVVVVDPEEPREALAEPPPFGIGVSEPQAAVAVIAEHYWQAKTALEALPLEWAPGDGARWTSNQVIHDAVMEAVRQSGEITHAEGDAPTRIKEAAQLVEAEYFTGYADHVTLEPLNGTALVTEDRCELWMPTQHTQQAHFVAAAESGLPVEQVQVHQTFVGGGFGRRVFCDDARMVVAVARRFPGRPVHTIWSREESMRQGRFRAMIGARLEAGLDASGYPVGLRIHHAGKGQGVRGLNDTAYLAGGGIPTLQVEQTILPLHLMTGPYRGPSYNVNAFIMESFIDELAHRAGIDPLEYRLALLEPWADKGWAKLLKTVAERAGWGRTLPRGEGLGIAIANWGGEGRPHHGSSAAAAVRVSCSREGELRILQIDAGCDVGTIVNPDAVRAQIQGGTIFGLNMAMLEELEIENGVVVSDNFHRYPMLRIRDIPADFHVHLDATSGHERINEIGEPPVGPVGPALANAIFQATGKRVRSLPLRKADLSWS